MNAKQRAAKRAVELIEPNTRVGLGMGSTMASMVAFLQEKNISVELFTSSEATKTLMEENGFSVGDISKVSWLDIYFDGCDQFDENLNALKSGGGIHTQEKLLASMAKEFVLVGDESKYVPELTTQYPLVLEVIPQAINYVTEAIQKKYPIERLFIRKEKNGDDNRTVNGNHLINIYFSKMPSLYILHKDVKSIVGVLETSLFYNLATLAVIASDDDVRVLGKKSK